jgi:hypothetical protein
MTGAGDLPGESKRRTGAAIAAVAGLIAFSGALWAPQVLADGDSWWHVAAGRLMIARHGLITADPFSYTWAGRPWLDHEWLAQVILGGAFDAGGWSGVVLATACAAGLAAWLLARDVGRWLSGAPLAITIGCALALIGPHLLARPHMLALPILEAWCAGLILARAKGRAPCWALAPLMTLWANVHGSFIFGLCLAGFFALEAAIAAPRQVRRDVVLRWGAFCLSSVGAALITPHGVAGLLLPLKLTGMGGLAHIGEWAPADFTRPQPLAIALAAGAWAFATRTVRLAPLRGLLVVGLVFLALQHQRHEMLLAVVAALVLAEPLAQAYGQGADVAALSVPQAPRLSPFWAAGVAFVVIAMSGARLLDPVARRDGPTAPIQALAAVPPAVAARPVLNDYAFGGYLIAAGVAPFIDSRADMYGDAFLADYARLAGGDRAALARVLTKRAVGWTILTPGTPLARAMEAMPGWRRLYADRWAEIEVPAERGA